MLKLLTLVIIPLSLEVLTIDSIILHERKVMKERNFGNEVKLSRNSDTCEIVRASWIIIF